MGSPLGIIPEELWLKVEEFLDCDHRMLLEVVVKTWLRCLYMGNGNFLDSLYRLHFPRQ